MPFVAQVIREVDGRHPATPKLAFEGVPAPEAVRELGAELCQKCPCADAVGEPESVVLKELRRRPVVFMIRGWARAVQSGENQGRRAGEAVGTLAA